MIPRRIRLVLAGAALVLGAALLLLVSVRRATPRPPAAPAAQAGAPSPARDSPASTAAQAGDGPGERSRLADDLNSPGRDVHSDLRIADGIFAAYRGALHEGNPVGENREITAALSGRNRLGYAFLPADSPALNPAGELCDRWGMPYFFHQLSGERMEIRSAGPDRRLWTADDEVLTP